jgi:uncharacterized hydrophobic protein (TIGR00271 family)
MSAQRHLSLGGRLHGGEVTTTDLEALAGKLYFDRERGGDAYVRFWVLLVLSVVIAAGGVITDSTAVVIGAMIVAPLMTPIMGVALGVVTGDLGHIRRSLLLVAAGTAVAIGLAFLMGVGASLIVNEANNSQVAARTSPRTMDLVVALASGAAGAFALSREKVSDALPGVAIAISLVPPLCVVGIMLANGDPGAALGALLLFVTNFLAILIAGGGVLAFMGYRRVALEGVVPGYRRRAAAVIGLSTLVILVPLATASVRVARDSLVEFEVRSRAVASLPESALLASVQVVGDELNVVLETVGLVDASAIETAAREIQANFPELTINVYLIDRELVSIPAQR